MTGVMESRARAPAVVRGPRAMPPLLGVAYIAGAVGFASFERAALVEFAESRRTTPAYWDLVLGVASSGYLLCYWVLPIATWCMLRQIRNNARPEAFIRYPTRTDWTMAQGRLALPWIAVLAATPVGVGLLAGAGYPVSWWWGSAASGRVLDDLPALASSVPVPALALALQVVTTGATLAALTIICAAVAAMVDRPRAAVGAALALLLWGIVSFRTSGWVPTFLGPPTYALPVLAAVRGFPFGPWGAMVVLVVIGALGYRVARRLEVYRTRLGDVPAGPVVLLSGALVLLGLVGMLPSDEGDPGALTLMLLQGVGTDGVSLLPYLANTILVLVPAIAVHGDLVTALTGRRYAEMVRLPSPAHWYGRHLRSAAVLCTGYGLAMAIVAVLAVLVRVREPVTADVLILAGYWGLALAAQSLVVTVVLALVTVLARRVEGGAYALAGALVLAWPLGAVSRWTPTGQASLARATDLSNPGSPIIQSLHPLPLLVLAAWLIPLTATTLLLFNRTRGEIH